MKYVVNISVVIRVEHTPVVEGVARYLGERLIGRPIRNQVIRFIEELTPEEYMQLRAAEPDSEQICENLRNGWHSVPAIDFEVGTVHIDEP